MKRIKRGKWIQFAILVVLGALVVLAMLLPELSTLRGKPAPVEISVIIREADGSLWSNARLGMEQAAYDLGAELRFLVPGRANSIQEQQLLALREIEGGSAALIVAPAGNEAAALWGESGKLAVPVVVLESGAGPAAAAVLPNNAALGTALADALLQDVPGGRVLLLQTEQASVGASQRLDAAQAALQQAGLQVVVHQSASPAAQLPALVAQHRPAAVMAFEPMDTHAAAEALEELTAPPPLYGVGGASYITAQAERGTLAAVAVWNEYEEGYLAVQQAFAAAHKQQVQNCEVAVTIIRGEDIYVPNNQKILFPITH